MSIFKSGKPLSENQYVSTFKKQNRGSFDMSNIIKKILIVKGWGGIPLFLNRFLPQPGNNMKIDLSPKNDSKIALSPKMTNPSSMVFPKKNS